MGSSTVNSQYYDLYRPKTGSTCPIQEMYHTTAFTRSYYLYSSDLSDSYIIQFNVLFSLSNDVFIIDLSKDKNFYIDYFYNFPSYSIIYSLLKYLVNYIYEPFVDKSYLMSTLLARSMCDYASTGFSCFSFDSTYDPYTLNNPIYTISPQRINISHVDNAYQFGNVSAGGADVSFDKDKFLQLLSSSDLKNKILLTYFNARDIEKTLNLTKPLVEKAMKDMPSESQVIGDSVDLVNAQLLSTILNESLIDNVTDRMVASGKFDNASGGGSSKDVVNAIDDLPNKIIGDYNFNNAPAPTFDDKYEEVQKSSIGELLGSIKLPLLETFKSSKIQLENSSCSVSFRVYNRDVDLSVCGFESEISVFGQLMVAFSTLTSVLYIFQRQS